MHKNILLLSYFTMNYDMLWNFAQKNNNIYFIIWSSEPSKTYLKIVGVYKYQLCLFALDINLEKRCHKGIESEKYAYVTQIRAFIAIFADT